MTDTNKEQHLEDLAQIKHFMERSSKFPALSGISGIIVGSLALMGAITAYWFLMTDPSANFFNSPYNVKGPLTYSSIHFMLYDGAAVLLGALITGYWFAKKRAEQMNHSITDPLAKQLISSLLIPMGAGGLLILAMIYHGVLFMIAPISLIFYGLGLINCSKYTVSEIKTLGLLEVVIGLVSVMIVGEALLFWAIGFGLLHIIFGIILYNKYEKSA